MLYVIPYVYKVWEMTFFASYCISQSNQVQNTLKYNPQSTQYYIIPSYTYYIATVLPPKFMRYELGFKLVPQER